MEADAEKEHRFGLPDVSYAKFLKRSIQLTSNFPVKQTQGLHKHLLLTYKDAILLRGKQSSTSINQDGERQNAEDNESSLADLEAVCAYCGSDGRRTTRIVPKPKTTRAVIKSNRKQARAKSTPSDFEKHVLEIYYNKPNRVQLQCMSCKQAVTKNGEKRNSKTFVEKHSVRNRQRRLKRKQSAKNETDNDSSVDISAASTSGLGSSLELSFAGATSSPLISKVRKASITSSISISSQKSLQQRTSSPMSSLRSDSAGGETSQRLMFKPAVMSRVTNKNSAAILRKFQQNHVDSIMKADKKKQEETKKKGSALDSFLKAMK